MILDRMDTARRYEPLHPGFRAAFDFLTASNLAALPVGRHEIEGDHVFALISRGPMAGRQAARLEFHRRYIDIQFIVEGTEEAGWRPTGQCAKVASAYDEQRDIGFFGDPAGTWITLSPGTFAIYFPQDAHAPMAGVGEVHKVVIKVAV